MIKAIATLLCSLVLSPSAIAGELDANFKAEIAELRRSYYCDKSSDSSVCKVLRDEPLLVLKKQMGCDFFEGYDVDSDPCIYFGNEKLSGIFRSYEKDNENADALIAINGKVRKLKLINGSSYLNPVKREQYVDFIDGDAFFELYEAEGIKVEHNSIVSGTGCTYQDEDGVYRSEEKCCYDTFEDHFKLELDGIVYYFKTMSDVGAG